VKCFWPLMRYAQTLEHATMLSTQLDNGHATPLRCYREDPTRTLSEVITVREAT
jgi:hypothetical protein